MRSLLLVSASLFLTAIADQNNIDWDSSTVLNDEFNLDAPADVNSLFSFNEILADSNDAGDSRNNDPCNNLFSSESPVQLYAVLDQAGIDDPVDGACNARNRQFQDPGKIREDPSDVAPDGVQDQRKIREDPWNVDPEWFEKCKGTNYIFELCCKGKTYRSKPERAGRKQSTIWTPRTVEECIWGRFLFLALLPCQSEYSQPCGFHNY